MTETELTDRLREAIVLYGPDVWRTNGYLKDAPKAGLSEDEAIKRASDVNQEVANNSLLFQSIQTRIARLTVPSRSQYIEQDINQIINAAASLKLSPDFVKNRWIPTVLQRLEVASKPIRTEPIVVPAPKPVETPTFEELIDRKPEPPKAVIPEPAVTQPAPVVPPVKAGPAVTKPAPAVAPQPAIAKPTPSIPVPDPVVTRQAPSPVNRSTTTRPAPVVASPTPAPTRSVTPPQPAATEKIPERPPVVRSFTATPGRVRKGQPVTLAWSVDNLLAVTIDDLGEGLSPVNRGWVKPTKTTDYTLFDANNNPLSTVRVVVIEPDRSGIYGVLFALALLAGIYWYIKRNNSQAPDDEPKARMEQKTDSSSGKRKSRKRSINQEQAQKPIEVSPDEETYIPPDMIDKSDVAIVEKPKKADPPVIRKQPKEEIASSEPEPKPATPADARQGKYKEAFGDKPYDKVELGTDERGWRRARSQGRWGFINEQDEWVIKPEFEAVTPFRGNTAAVFQNGQLMTINRQGEQVKN
ncbi:WG repeat-containing protein [Spirosoma fluviale]|uniref:WG containing repeat-containing protein n=1 Tax=Spirosoma fluviale TaxID=1597977 RepID=A0A286GVZ9_9BACT|nr:WG repeat-containing protein [Spirosoma fluviale]SOD99662.1 WG containing repeat-containing protein [Spirosoma fluviale]